MPPSIMWGIPHPLTQIGNNLNFACSLFFLFHVLYLGVLKPSFPQAKTDESRHILLSWRYSEFILQMIVFHTPVDTQISRVVHTNLLLKAKICQRHSYVGL